MTFELATEAAVARRRKPTPSSSSAHPSFQLQHEHSSKIIPPALSHNKGEVCNKDQEPPFPGAAGIASLYTRNVLH